MSAIVIIAPFEGLARVAEKTCQQLGERIPVITASMDEAVKAAKRAEKDGVEVIISRGTTGWKIAQAGIGIPLVQIPITGYDLLRAFLEARQRGNKIGIADTPDVLRGVESLETLFSCRIEKQPIRAPGEVEQAVRRLIDRGIDVLIGKWVYVQAVKKFGVNSVVLTSGPESVIQAISEAKNVLEVRRAEAARTQQLRAILDHIADGVIAVDAQGRVTVCNPAVEKILRIPVNDVVGKKIDEILPGSRIRHVLRAGKEELNRVEEENGVKIVAHRIPIRHGSRVIGVVNTFQELRKWQQQEQEIRQKLSQRGHVTKYRTGDVIGNSEAFQQAFAKVKKYAKADSTVLLAGETGVGKEVFAHLLHSLSPRANGPFVAVNCAAIPENLLESELFGYVEGAFTGAKKGGKTGLFELAHRGTIFLDEIGELAPALQARILRVLQEGEVMRLGDEQIIPIDVRVVAATNRDLEEMVAQGRFRADLFYRLNVLHIEIPPLRERKEDIPLLCDFFLNELQADVRKRITGFSEKAMELLQAYDWPGNIRELRNIVERAMILAPGEEIDRATLIEAGGKAFQELGADDDPKRQKPPLSQLREYEREHILRVLRQVGGNRTEAARILGIGRTTLWRKLNEK
ncbi:sigma-54-dependent Fis family transcriptional regulator [Bacillaceae bacterium]